MKVVLIIVFKMKMYLYEILDFEVIKVFIYNSLLLEWY